MKEGEPLGDLACDGSGLQAEGGGFTLGYTVDLAVSDDHLIVGQRATQAVSDSASLLPLVSKWSGRAGRGRNKSVRIAVSFRSPT